MGGEGFGEVGTIHELPYLLKPNKEMMEWMEECDLYQEFACWA